MLPSSHSPSKRSLSPFTKASEQTPQSPAKRLQTESTYTVEPNKAAPSNEDWVHIGELNREVFHLLQETAYAQVEDPLELLNQRLGHAYPGIEIREDLSTGGAAVSLLSGAILVRHDFMQRICKASNASDSLIARAIVTDCIVCSLTHLHQTQQLFVRQLDRLSANGSQLFQTSRHMALNAYHGASALPPPDAFSTLCVMTEIPL